MVVPRRGRYYTVQLLGSDSHDAVPRADGRGRRADGTPTRTATGKQKKGFKRGRCSGGATPRTPARRLSFGIDSNQRAPKTATKQQPHSNLPWMHAAVPRSCPRLHPRRTSDACGSRRLWCRVAPASSLPRCLLPLAALGIFFSTAARKRVPATHPNVHSLEVQTAVALAMSTL